jgi:serine/threonine-protein kinase HipA
MMKMWVYADFNWLKEVELIGELSFENLRGSGTYGFHYSKEWLKKHSDILLSDDINNYPGMQYTQQGKDIFGCFSDALPDRWGRMLIDRREQILAQRLEDNG